MHLMLNPRSFIRFNLNYKISFNYVFLNIMPASGLILFKELLVLVEQPFGRKISGQLCLNNFIIYFQVKKPFKGKGAGQCRFILPGNIAYLGSIKVFLISQFFAILSYTIVHNLQRIRYAITQLVKKHWIEETPLSVCASNTSFLLILIRYKNTHTTRWLLRTVTNYFIC